LWAILPEVELPRFAIPIVFLGLAFGACTRVKQAGPSANIPIAGGGFAGEPSDPGVMPGIGGSPAGGEPNGPGGAPASVEFGLWPTFASNSQQSSDVQAVLASVSALAVGSPTLPLSERWDSLSGSTGSPRVVTWNRLDAMSKPYRERGASMALCIGIVDRENAAWPFEGELDTEAASSAMQRTIDEVFTRYAAQLSHLCFGYELDRYLAKVSSGSRVRLLSFLKQSIAYASQHPMRGSRTRIGAAITLGALSQATDAPLDDLLLGDEVVAVYDPLDVHAELKPPGSVAAELSAALETITSQPGVALPLTLFEVGYPSSSAAGSSEADQLAYYDSLFDAVASRRDALGLVGVFGLGDRAAADCEAEAALFGDGLDGQAERALVRCSMGLRAESDKAAWSSVLAAFSRFR
jgi:hypothetical protein